MHVAVVGPGSLGSLLAALFREAGDDVRLVARTPQQARAIEERGLHLCEEGRTRVVRIPCAAELAPHPAPDWILVCVKAYDTREAARRLSGSRGPGTVVVTIQNGLGNREALERHVPTGQILIASTALAANRRADGTVVHAGSGITRVAPAHAHGDSVAVARFVQLLKDRRIPAEPAPDPDALLWSKLAVSAAINPLTAIHDLPNGALPNDENLLLTALEAGRETLAVAAAKGIAVDRDGLESRLRGVCEHTAANISSMLQDVRAGRRTEIDQISGAVCREGRRLGVPTPTNAELLARVSALGTPASKDD